MVLQPVDVVYCNKCGMPPEYCEYGPDYERVCEPYLKRKHPDLYAKIMAIKGKISEEGDDGDDHDDAAVESSRPVAPWTTEERLTEFYKKYVPEKVSDVPSLLEKYAGKEDKLFTALGKKYGSEPEDPYYAESSDDDDDDDSYGDDDDADDLADRTAGLAVSSTKKKRRGIKAKKAVKSETRVLIQKLTRNRKKATTVVVGMDTVENVNLKDVAKAFSKRFAGSSSVKDGKAGGSKEIIVQGDHMEDVAEMIVSKFKVDATCVFLDFDGDFVPYKK